MEMHQVRYFLAVAQELNFSRAAEKCNVSQPSLSRAIQQLEGELGGPLFHRERHLTHLTELGEMVRPHLETVYEAAVKAKRLSQDLSQQKRVPLKLGIMSTISPDEIVDLIAALKNGTMGLNFVFVMQTPRICGIGCLPATSRSSSMHYRAKNSTSAPTLCRCFVSRWLSRSIAIIGLLASARSQ